MYHPKSIVAFTVRRKDKQYCKGIDVASAIANSFLNEGNHKTYFLIRNGTNIYRIFSDISLGATVFPTKAMYEQVMKDYANYGPEHIAEKIQEKHETFMYGLAAIQGLLERTQLFGNELQGRVNLFNGNFTADQIQLVRDAEQELWIGDGRLSWNDYIKRNRETIAQGTRIVLTKSFSDTYGTRDHDNHWRYSPFRPSSRPRTDEIYIVEEKIDKKERYSERGEFLIRFHSDDTIYPEDVWKDAHQRTKRVLYRFYADECVNVDAITVEDCEYYLHNRFERVRYLDVLPILHWTMKVKREEAAYEKDFENLVITRLRLDESARDTVRKVVQWWKLKNKWKRGVKADEPKALRMVEQRVKKELKLT